MNLKEIAQFALDEALEVAETEVQQNPDTDNTSKEDGAKETQNEDGTVNLEFSFTLDPVVVAQKAKAMSKGVKRDDLVDTELDDGEGDEGEEVFADDVNDDAEQEFNPDDDSEGEGDTSGEESEEDEEDIYNDVHVEDSALDARETIFMDALDSIEGVDTMDARQNSRHAQTPLENCRAKDPRFCPYHGIPAWSKHLEDALSSSGIQGSVDVKNDNGTFTVKISNVNPNQSADANKVIDDILATNGVKHSATGFKSDGNDPSGNYFAGAKFWQDRTMTDRTGRLNEWVDDFITDYAADPDAKIDMDDFSALLEAQEELETFEKGMNPQNANDVQKYQGMVDKAEKMYHSLIAQQYFDDVDTTQDALNVGKNIQSEFDKAYNSTHKGLDEVNAAKKAIFGITTFPSKNVKRGIPSFQETYDWVKKYNNATRGMHTAHVDYSTAAMQNLQGDIKEARTVLSEMDYKKDNYVLRAQKFPEIQKSFMQSFYDWANNEAQNQGNKFGITASKVQAAWPNGRPQ